MDGLSSPEPTWNVRFINILFSIFIRFSIIKWVSTARLTFLFPIFFFFQAHIAQISLGIAFYIALPNGVVQVCAGLLRLAN